MKLKLISWNINGIRAGIKKGLWEKVDTLNPDVICFQETKSDEQIMLTPEVRHQNYRTIFHSCSVKKGYSGVATLSKANENFGGELILGDEIKTATNPLEIESFQIGLGIPEFDAEGRIVIIHYTIKTDSGENFKFTLFNGYFPQGGRVGRVPFKIRFYEEVSNLVQQMRLEGRKVIICGDLNTTVGDIDLARPKENRKTTGCLPEEREALDLFLKNGFIDSFRYFYPDTPDKYSYWDQITRARERNVGWRIDYFLVDEALKPNLKSATILDEIMGSDHCPVVIELEI